MHVMYPEHTHHIHITQHQPEPQPAESPALPAEIRRVVRPLGNAQDTLLDYGYFKVRFTCV